MSDPTAEDLSAPTTPQPPSSTTPSYQQVAAHTLEALSTAAADHVSYPPQNTAYYTAPGPHTSSQPEYSFVRSDSTAGAAGGPGTHINFLLNPAQGQTSSLLIDPNLEATVAQAAEQAVDMKSPVNNDDEQTAESKENHKSQEQEESMGDSDSRVAMALRTFNETSG